MKVPRVNVVGSRECGLLWTMTLIVCTMLISSAWFDISFRLTPHKSKMILPADRAAQGQSTPAAPVVCLLGNAQTVDMARKVSAYWPKYHAFWAVWGQPAADVTPHQWPLSWARVFGNHGTSAPSSDVLFWPFACPKGACPWKVGMELALAQARASGVPCEYFFTSDDDSDWYLSSDPAGPSYSPNHTTPALSAPTSVGDELTHLLTLWRPAVASFGWEYGDKSFPGAAAFVKAANGFPVSLLTSFDNGNALYHASVIDFIVSFGPSGEGGFVGNWTLPASWLNMLVPFAFQGQAMRVNSIVYTNNMNMNNGEATLGHKPKTAMENGNFVTEAARHPYEFPRRKPFEAYMATGIIPPPGAQTSDINGVQSHRWGQHLSPSDVTWTLSVGHPPFTPAAISTQLATRFDITHEAAAGALLRWSKAWSKAYELRVVQLTSSMELAVARSVVQELTRPVPVPADGFGTSGFLASTGTTTTSLLVAVPVPNHFVTQPAVPTRTDSSQQASPDSSPFPVDIVQLSGQDSVVDILHTLWPTQPRSPASVSGSFHQPQSLVLLQSGRRTSRQAFHWAKLCVQAFAPWTGVLGCALEALPPTPSGVAPPRSYTVRSADPKFQLFVAVPEFAAMATGLRGAQTTSAALQAAHTEGAVATVRVLQAATEPSLFRVLVQPASPLRGGGMIITRAAWVSMLQRIEAAVALARPVPLAPVGETLPVATLLGADGATTPPAASVAGTVPNLQLSPACLTLIAQFDVPQSEVDDEVRLGDSGKLQLVWSLVEQCLPVHGAINGLVFPSHLP